MPRSTNQKMKLLYLQKLFMEETDEKHGVTLQDITDYLAKYDISVERKTIYSDIETLRQFGLDIIGQKSGGNYYYYLADREFELAELKLLVDSVQASKFITRKKSDSLIKKLESLTSSYEAKQLQRQVLVQDRIKTMNESIYYNVDALNAAFNNNVAIDFDYYAWTLEKKLERKDTKSDISPWALIWDNENYYLLAYDLNAGIMKHYRVDKMRNIRLTTDTRKGLELYNKLDMARYTERVFDMYGGTEENVTIEFENSMIGVVMDRFGKDVMVIRCDEKHFRIHVDVEVSETFLSWIFGLGGRAKLISPQNVVEKMKDMAKAII